MQSFLLHVLNSALFSFLLIYGCYIVIFYSALLPTTVIMVPFHTCTATVLFLVKIFKTLNHNCRVLDVQKGNTGHCLVLILQRMSECLYVKEAYVERCETVPHQVFEVNFIPMLHSPTLALVAKASTGCF